MVLQCISPDKNRILMKLFITPTELRWKERRVGGEALSQIGIGAILGQSLLEFVGSMSMYSCVLIKIRYTLWIIL